MYRRIGIVIEEYAEVWKDIQRYRRIGRGIEG